MSAGISRVMEPGDVTPLLYSTMGWTRPTVTARTIQQQNGRSPAHSLLMNMLSQRKRSPQNAAMRKPMNRLGANGIDFFLRNEFSSFP